MQLSGWGRVSQTHAQVGRPERQADLMAVLSEVGREGLIAHGGGRAYGDAALNTGGRAVLMTRLDRMLAFDPATGDVLVEPGVTFRDLLNVFLSRGFMAPTSPGTAFATVGGAVATDAHGKNHDRHGSFGDHVRWIDLLTADGTTRRVSPESEADLFAATIGGMGLTGLIRAVCFRLLPQAAPSVIVRERRIPNLDAFLAAFAEVRDKATFSVGWIDALATGPETGRGILETAEFMPSAFAGAETRARPRRARSIPVDLPGFVVNPHTVRGFNELYFRRIPEKGRERTVALVDFLYPLDAIHHWNRIYGKRGFYQFQCVLPDAAAAAGLPRMLEEIARAGAASFLAVLKTLGREGRGHLSFPMRGFTLALDFPRRDGADTLIKRLEAMTRYHGGRVYLAKDALLSPESLRAMYPRTSQFMEVLSRIDPEGLFTSDLARRLALKPRRPGGAGA